MQNNSELELSSVNYSSHKWWGIMNKENFSLEIMKMLENELYFLKAKISDQKYDLVIEIGCGEGKNAFFLSQFVNYVGLDADKMFIEKAKSVMKEHSVENARFYNLSSHQLDQILIPIDFKVLVFIPFNLFGNLSNPTSMLDDIFFRNWDLAIFTYQDNDLTQRERFKYYRNCGIEIEYKNHGEYSTFRSKDGFDSKVYSEIFMKEKMLRKFVPTYKLEVNQIEGMETVYFLESKLI